MNKRQFWRKNILDVFNRMTEKKSDGTSRYKLPLNLNYNKSSVYNITKGIGPAKMLQECSCIVWNEILMTILHKRTLEAANRTLKDCVQISSS